MFYYNNYTDKQKEAFQMKLLNKQIDMISWTSSEGIVYKSVIAKSLQNIFDKGIMCISISSAKSKRSKTEYVYELTYNCGSQKWRLKKI